MRPVVTIEVDDAGVAHARIHEDGQRAVVDADQLAGLLHRVAAMASAYGPVRGAVDRWTYRTRDEWSSPDN